MTNSAAAACLARPAAGRPLPRSAPPGGFWIRFVAYIIDGFIVTIAAIAIVGIFIGRRPCRRSIDRRRQGLR